MDVPKKRKYMQILNPRYRQDSVTSQTHRKWTALAEKYVAQCEADGLYYYEFIIYVHFNFSTKK